MVPVEPVVPKEDAGSARAVAEALRSSAGRAAAVVATLAEVVMALVKELVVAAPWEVHMSLVRPSTNATGGARRRVEGI